MEVQGIYAQQQVPLMASAVIWVLLSIIFWPINCAVGLVTIRRDSHQFPPVYILHTSDDYRKSVV